jgi:galactokinase
MRIDTKSLADQFQETFGTRPTLIAEAPGRVNLIGEHTDYNEGFVLPMAIDRRVRVAAVPRADRKVRAFAVEARARDEWRIDAPRRTGRREWRDYVRGVAWGLLEARLDIGGADLLISGDVPQGTGLSSSAALEVAVAGALAAASGVEADGRTLALACQRAENQFVGVQCGIMDQFASALARKGHALLIDCRSLDVQQVPLRTGDDGLRIVVVDSGVQRRLGETAYNERRQECVEAAKRLGVESLRDADESRVTELKGTLQGRARHVVRENERVLGAAEVLRQNDYERFGALMLESHESLRDDFEVSCAELDRLVELARSVPGVLGARLTGAGFGGCTVNLMRDDAVRSFKLEVTDRYTAETGLRADMQAVEPVGKLEVRRV